MEWRNKITLAACLLFTLTGFSSAANSAPQGQGRVNMQGAIIDTACAIATESREQIINMDITPISEIARDGKGRAVPFSIELINCVLERPGKKQPSWSQFQITFDGKAEGDLFSVNGDISGVGLRIADSAGNIAVPGTPLPLRDIIPGSYQLNYGITLLSNKQPLKAGSYFSSVRFKMDYY
ncbi:fimbrial protein [Serratia marcescens]|uniref:fimbrial protein n=1 Tax=Serratia TaxID=613 RepID=UPI0005392024|nr:MULTISPECIES: fimbrial protein [Serratia]MBN5225161.1 type 1 fimbrial protein [Serratia ureilytica]PNO37753.1 type 1 fimbrial protein [Serratia marcescens]